MGPPLAVKGNVPQFSRPEAGLPTRKLHCGSRAAKSGQAGYTSALNWSLQAPTVVFPPRPQKNGLEDSSTTTSRWPSLRATLTRAWRSSSEPSRNADDPSRAQGPRRPARSRCYRPLAFASRSAIMGPGAHCLPGPGDTWGFRAAALKAEMQNGDPPGRSGELAPLQCDAHDFCRSDLAASSAGSPFS